MKRPILITPLALAPLWLCLHETAAFAPPAATRTISASRVSRGPSIGSNARRHMPARVGRTATIDTEQEQQQKIEYDEECDLLSPEECEMLMNPEEERDFLKDALLQSVIFTSLPNESLDALMDAFETVEFTKKDIIYTQGDACESDYVYIVGTGQCLVEVDGKALAPPFKTLSAKSIFGEIGIMYNQTRASTVSCRSDAVRLFRIPRDDFKNILNQRIVLFENDDNNYGDTASDYDLEDEKEQLEAIDDVIREIEGTKSLYDGAIIRPYKPNRTWLWRQFRGTILQHVAIPTMLNMLWSVIFIVFVRHRVSGHFSWTGLGLPPDPTNPFIAKLGMLHKVWSYQQALTTFILTFFLNQSFSFWREIYDIGRNIQGRINDFNIILATTAVRKTDGTYTQKAEALLDDVGQYSRLFHTLMWAAYSRRFRVLGTPRGMERMATRGLMNSKQLDVLLNLDLPEDQKHSACLEWMMIRTDRSIADGTLLSDPAHRQMILAVMTSLRSTYAMVKDKMDGRMPLAYTHFVQILVDTFVWTAPIALYSELGAWSVICVGVLTLFYTGLLNLAKIFLDPLDNEDFCKDSIFMDIGVLIRESNAGSARWKNGAARLPF